MNNSVCVRLEFYNTRSIIYWNVAVKENVLSKFRAALISCTKPLPIVGSRHALVSIMRYIAIFIQRYFNVKCQHADI